MGSWFSSYWGYPDDNVVDPSSGLTGRQKRIVKETWNIMYRDPVKLGVAIMQKYFSKYPEYQTLFRAFKDTPLEDLPNNKRFQAHSAGVVSVIDSAINSLNDPGLLEATLLITGEKHHKRGQNKQQFNDLKPIIVDTFKQFLGPRWTQEVIDAWTITLNAVYSILFKAFA